VNRYLIRFFFLFALFSGGKEVVAQALPTATAPGAYIAVGGTYSIFQSNYGQRVLGGGGVFADVNPVRPLGIEAEGRWLRQNALANTTESTYLIGPRMQFRRGPLSPYVKVLAGLGHFNFPYNDAHGSYFVIAPGAGVDFYVNSSLKIRLVDIEYQQWPQFTFGTISPYGVSFGLSYRVFNGSR
jgi:hypothetical protein